MMNFHPSSSFLPRISLGGSKSPFLPLHAQSRSPQRSSPRRSSDYDLSELSSRPSSPLLSPDTIHDFGHPDSSYMDRDISAAPKGKTKAVGYADQVPFPPMSVADRMRLSREARAGSSERNKQQWAQGKRNYPSWKLPSPSDQKDDAENEKTNQIPGQIPGLHVSFVGSMLLGRSSASKDLGAVDMDTTFRTIARREKQIHTELQNLLDAQMDALARNAGEGDPPNHNGGGSEIGSATPRGSTSRTPSEGSNSPMRSRFGRHNDHESPVIPVRQPKPKPLSVRQVRTSIARSISMLADLKAEDDACILSALSVRKAALAKLTKLSKQHKSISADLRTLESNPEDPIRGEIEAMQAQHRTVVADIEEYEQKLRALKRAQRDLERRMEEAESERESGLSGYRGALRDTERGIGEMMTRPGVKVLEAESVVASDSFIPEGEKHGPDHGTNGGHSTVGLVERCLNGQEFMKLRPERRTLGMAREWWEGEVSLLERRKAAVDRERVALEEGGEIWSHVIEIITVYEQHLKEALLSTLEPTKPELQRQSQEKIFIQQYQDLRNTLGELRKSFKYCEGKGWNLLVAAIGAELDGFAEGEKILLQVMQANGIEYANHDDYLVSDHTEEDSVRTGHLVDLGHNGTDRNRSPPAENKLEQQDSHEDELTGSVRRWTETDATQPSPIDASPNLRSGVREQMSNSNPSLYMSASKSLDQDHLNAGRELHCNEHRESEHKEESDNEVPPGLLSEVHVEESEDEHGNDVPAEFLSMHGVAWDTPSKRGSEDDGHSVAMPHDLLGEGRKDDYVD